MAEKSPFENQHWRVWHLDSELRYRPALEALPAHNGLPLCEIGGGPSGVAAWTERSVVGVDPGDDHRHGPFATEAPNLERVRASGTSLPLADNSMAAALAVDTFEHIPRNERARVVSEMARVTAPGGSVVIMGPAGDAAGAGDRWLIDRARRAKREAPWAEWLLEHLEHGLPSVEELRSYLAGVGATDITASGIFNIRLWRIMHLVSLGELPEPRDPIYAAVWGPFGALARRYRRGPFYRWLVVGRV